MSSAAPIPLQYAAPATTPSPRGRRLAWLVFALSAPATVVPFVPFTYNTSPWDVAREASRIALGGGMSDASMLALYACGLTYFLIVPLLAWRLRLLLGRLPGRAEGRVAVVAALLLSAPAVYLATRFVWQAVTEFTPPTAADEWLQYVALGVMLICLLGGWALGARLARRARTGDAAIALLSTAYLANASFCLLAFHDDPLVGYWLTLAAAPVMVAELVSFAGIGRRREDDGVRHRDAVAGLSSSVQ